MTKTTKVILGVASGFCVVFAATMMVALIALAWLPGTHRSPDGFVTSGALNLTTDGYAITSTDIDFGPGSTTWLPSNILGTLRVEAASVDSSPVFIGVGPSDEVNAYLEDVSRGVVSNFGPWRRVEVAEEPGTAVPARPDDASFWTVSTAGSGAQAVDWDAEWGEWTLVIMNSDGSPGVDVSTTIGVNTPWLPAGITVIAVIAVLATAAGIVLAVLALRRPANPRAVESTPQQHARIAG